MNRAAIALSLTAAGLLLIGSTSRNRGVIESGEAGPLFDLGNLASTLESTMHQTTQAFSTERPPADLAARNVAAFLAMLQAAEGTSQGGRDAYRVVYGYGRTLASLADHPTVTGEWRGERLSEAMCRNAGFGPGCVSTAAGAYQIIRPTWLRLKRDLRLPDFERESQDRAAVELIRQRGALIDVQAGRVIDAIQKCRQEWASLPGNNARQGQRSTATLQAWYTNNGGLLT